MKQWEALRLTVPSGCQVSSRKTRCFSECSLAQLLGDLGYTVSILTLLQSISIALCSCMCVCPHEHSQWWVAYSFVPIIKNKRDRKNLLLNLKKWVLNFMPTPAYNNLRQLLPGFSLFSTTGVHAQSCPALCDPMDFSSSGSSVHGISQARILDWIAIPFRDLPDLGIEPTSPMSPELAGRFSTTGPPGSLYHTTEKVKLLLSDFSINRQCYTRLRNYTAWHRDFLSPSSQKGVQTYCLSDARRKVVPSHLRLMPRSWADLEKNKQLRCWKLTEGEDTQAGWGCTQDA